MRNSIPLDSSSQIQPTCILAKTKSLIYVRRSGNKQVSLIAE